jgi:hypothetical protein
MAPPPALDLEESAREAAPPVPAPSVKEEPPAVATTPPATPPAPPSQTPDPAPTPAEDPLPLASDERTAAPAAPAPMPAPSVPAPPPALPRAEPKPATATLIDESATPEPPPPAPEASPRPVPATLEPDTAQPTARDRGRPLIQRSNKVNSASASGATFASADGQTGVAFGAQIGGAARPIGVRSPDTTRQIIGSAKGTLAECYVNEQLFTAEAKGTAIVIIEVPTELPNRPRIETSDFSETMNACLLDAVRKLPFPGDPEGAAYRLRIPFRFRPD